MLHLPFTDVPLNSYYGSSGKNPIDGCTFSQKNEGKRDVQSAANSKVWLQLGQKLERPKKEGIEVGPDILFKKRTELLKRSKDWKFNNGVDLSYCDFLFY